MSVALSLAMASALAGCLDGSGQPSRTPRAAVVTLVGDIDPQTGVFRADRTRVVRVSLPGGVIEAERDLSQASRLDRSSGPLLATDRDRRNVFALIRNASAPDRIAVVDAHSLALRRTHPLAEGVRYSGLSLARSRVFAFGVRRAKPGRWDAVVTVSDPRTGELLNTTTVRRAEPAGGGHDWFVYWGALSEDERRLVLSYHGSDTTGADWLRVSPDAGVLPRGHGERRTDSGSTHGAVVAVRGRFLSATGTDHLLELGRDARLVRRLPVRARKTHLMDFAEDADRRLAYVSSCGRRPTIQRLDLARGRRQTVPSGAFCGRPLTVHADRYLILDADRVGRLGYPRTSPDGLRVLDLRKPGGGRRVPLPPSTGVLDAVVVQSPP
jgi:hypothetical protein